MFLRPSHGNVPSERPEVFRIASAEKSWIFWGQHHRSFHSIPHSPLNLIISCGTLSGSVCGRITELDWIGQWSHCKCITLTLPIFLPYLHTESQYYCRSTPWCRCMHVERFEDLRLYQCITIYSVALYHWSKQLYVKYTFRTGACFDEEKCLINKYAFRGCSAILIQLKSVKESAQEIKGRTKGTTWPSCY